MTAPEYHPKEMRRCIPQALPSEPAAEAVERSLNSLIRQANRSFEDYLNFLGQKEYSKASSALEDLQEALEKLAGRISDEK